MRQAILTLLAVCAGFLGMAGCSSHPHRWANEGVLAWGTVQPRVVEDQGFPTAVVIDVFLNDSDHVSALYSAARVLAREPGVVTVDGAISLNLPEGEGFRALRTDGDTMTNAEGYDPALSWVGGVHWVITIPLSSEEARRAIAKGGSIVILPNDTLMGLAFRW